MNRGRVSGARGRGSRSGPVARRSAGRGVATGAAISVLGLLAAGLWLSACGSIPIPRREMLRLYESAIVDTLEVEPSEVVTDLTVIRPEEPGLDWANGRVRMTSWTHRHRLLKPNREPTLRRELWVTPGGAVEDFCRPLDTSARELELRLEQLLGLAPGAGAGRRFVDLWVDPADLFRPCPDPAVDRVRCSPEVDPREISKEHREWLAETAETEYRPARRGGHPWTGLGYTYDWGNPYSDVGLTELVVRPGAKVRIGRVASTREYCRRR